MIEQHEQQARRIIHLISQTSKLDKTIPIQIEEVEFDVNDLEKGLATASRARHLNTPLGNLEDLNSKITTLTSFEI